MCLSTALVTGSGGIKGHTQKRRSFCAPRPLKLYLLKRSTYEQLLGAPEEDVLPKFLSGPASSPMFGLVAEVHIPGPQ